MADDELFQIILEPVEEEKQQTTALFLSGCFSLPPASTLRIASSGPIAILSDLSEDQSAAIMAELTPSLPEGVALRVSRESEAGEVSRLEWPRQPKIYGRPLADFSRAPDHGITPCPSCGKLLRISYVHDDGYTLVLAGKSGKTVMISNPDSEESDRDPLFSGFKPMAAASQDLASMRSLQAGDSSFWLDPGAFFPTAPNTPIPADSSPGETRREESTVQAAKSNTGLGAFMKSGAFAVILARSRDGQVVKMVAEIMGVSGDEARRLCLNMSLCLVKDVALSEAQNLLARLKSLGARARIIKPL